jgi:hypothetical protein
MSAARSLHRLFVGRIPWSVGKKQLTDYCSQYGKVVACQINYDKETGLSRGFGFVTFATRDAFVNITNQKSHPLEGNFLVFEYNKTVAFKGRGTDERRENETGTE